MPQGNDEIPRTNHPLSAISRANGTDKSSPDAKTQPQKDSEKTQEKATSETPSSHSSSASGAPAPQTDEQISEKLGVPGAAWKKIKSQERAKGAREANAEKEEIAKAAGYDSLEDALAAIAAHKKATEGKKTSPQAPETGTKKTPPASPDSSLPPGTTKEERAEFAKLDPEDQAKLKKLDLVEDFIAELRADREERKKIQAGEERARIKEEKRAKETQEAQAVEAATKEIREAALEAGVDKKKLRLVLAEFDAHTEEWDDKKFEKLDKAQMVEIFKGFKTEHPYFFGGNKTPATTGNSTTPGTQSAPSTKAVATNPANGVPDAMKLNGPDFDKFMRGLGVKRS